MLRLKDYLQVLRFEQAIVGPIIPPVTLERSAMEIKTPKVTLVSWTRHPFETVYVVWEASKNNGPLLSLNDVVLNVDEDEVRNLFRAVILQKIPVGEHVDFIFMLENVSVSWREQAVRHRIGVEISPERIGVDIIPDLAKSSWWSQSMRIQNMGRFADDGAYRVPQTILDHPEHEFLLERYKATMEEIQASYNVMVQYGIPMEDARDLIPLGAQHRISWKLNVGALQHILGKRGCWILQLGVWGPVIEGMVKELSSKIDPIFAELVTPPCLNEDNFTGCVYMEENRRRYSGEDDHPPCPLHWAHHHEHSGGVGMAHLSDIQDINLGNELAKRMRDRAEQYRSFWHRDPYTGRRLPVVK